MNMLVSHESEQARKDPFELEQMLEDKQILSTRLEQLRCMDSAILQSPESIVVYYRMLETAYAAYGRIETVIDERSASNLRLSIAAWMPLANKHIQWYSWKCHLAKQVLPHKFYNPKHGCSGAMAA
jgi:hypothetical protein